MHDHPGTPPAAPSPAPAPDMTATEIEAMLRAAGRSWAIRRGPLGTWSAERETRTGGHHVVRYMVARDPLALVRRIVAAEGKPDA